MSYRRVQDFKETDTLVSFTLILRSNDDRVEYGRTTLTANKPLTPAALRILIQQAEKDIEANSKGEDMVRAIAERLNHGD